MAGSAAAGIERADRWVHDVEKGGAIAKTNGRLWCFRGLFCVRGDPAVPAACAPIRKRQRALSITHIFSSQGRCEINPGRSVPEKPRLPSTEMRLRRDGWKLR